MTGPNRSADLRDIAQRLRRLAPSRHNPEKFHVEKDALAHKLEEIAGDVEMDSVFGPGASARRRIPLTSGTISDQRGRSIRVEVRRSRRAA